MATYISSNDNRFYVANESSYGRAQVVDTSMRFPAKGVHAHQQIQIGRRLDKTGTRTYLGSSSEGRRATAFAIQTYLTSWSGTSAPSCGPLFQAGLGAPPSFNPGPTITSALGLSQFQTAGPHGLLPGAGVSFYNEIRFVTGVPDDQSFLINAPFAEVPKSGDVFSPCVTYRPGTCLSSLSVYDYWDPITAVSRLSVGCAVNELSIKVNGDFHEFSFSGPAADLIDSVSFSKGAAGLAAFPLEPALIPFNYSVVPGHLGEVWLGGPANQFFTLTGASIEVRNNISLRSSEYGSSYPLGFSAGQREVSSRFSLLAQDDAQTVALYVAAKQRAAIPMMLQLGQRTGQVMGVFMQTVVPEIPVYDDSESRLQWEFINNRAQGVSNDEIVIAFA